MFGYRKNIEMLEANVRSLNEQMEMYRNKVEELENINRKQKFEIDMIKKFDESVFEKLKNQREVTISEDNVYKGIDYVDFENYFRGPQEEIKKRQSIYIPYFKNKNVVLDVGCGRGEFLELLSENSIEAYGVDLYDEFVTLCNGKGLKVFHEDAINAIKQANNLGGIFAGQIVEHLTLKQILELCDSAYNALSDEACLIIETPNPMSLAIYTHAFYIDPSHQKPVHPLTMKYILEKTGFKNIEIIYTECSRIPVKIPKLEGENNKEFNNAMKEVENVLFGSQDYAIVARK